VKFLSKISDISFPATCIKQMATPAPPPMMMVDPSALTLSSQVANTRADLLNAGANNTSAVLQSGSGDTQTLLQTACGDTASIIAATERQSFHTQAGVDRAAIATGNAIGSGFFETRGLMNGGAAENRATTNINGIESRGLLHSNFFENRVALNNGFTSNLLASKDTQLGICQSEGKVRHELSNVAGLLSGQISASREAISGLVGNLALQNQLEMSKYFAISERENNKQFALATLAASQNAAKIQEELAECCCEIKETVNSTANATQALIQASETNRIREELASAQQENLYLRLRPVT
jgi:hypothetical protein